MRKYIVRKNFDEKNIDSLNVPERSVFFEKNKKRIEQSKKLQRKIEREMDYDNSKTYNFKNNNLEKNDEILNSKAKKIFQESLIAMNVSDKKRMNLIYSQLESEKKISEELNKKLHRNLSKIASAEIELMRKKNNLEDELSEKTKQLVNAERFAAIGELSSRLAHELRTPLTVVKGSVDVIKLRKGMKIDDFVMQRLHLMEESVYRMNHQVEKVLTYVQKTPIEKKNNSLKKIIEKALILIKENPNISIKIPENDVMLNCDSIKMEVMLGNIILNSIQAIGTNKGEIIISLDNDENCTTITVQDSGKGIPENQISKIFDPLFSTKQDGTGLGLSSMKNIVEQHGGTITVKNNPTAFTISFRKKSQHI
ncbi:MAG: sensor histidine kinase [Nitrosopumilus sp.]